MLKITLRRHDAPSYRTAVVTFPAAEPDLQKAMDQISVGITTEKLCLTDAVQNDHGGLQALVGTLVNADELQYLAKRMESFGKRHERRKAGGGSLHRNGGVRIFDQIHLRHRH